MFIINVKEMLNIFYLNSLVLKLKHYSRFFFLMIYFQLMIRFYELNLFFLISPLLYDQIQHQKSFDMFYILNYYQPKRCLYDLY